MADLVLIHHNEPMTTSLAIADGVQVQHKNVLELVYKHINALSTFGTVGTDIVPPDESSGFECTNSAFQTAASHVGVKLETRNSRSTRGRPTEVIYLNEQQATLLVTFMRNSEIVVRFKVALVKAFYELRDRARSSEPAAMPRPVMSSIPGHAADLVVAADRTFRALKRSALSMGMEDSAANRYAREGASRITGTDVVAMLGIPGGAMMSAQEGLQKFMRSFNPEPYYEEDGCLDWWTAYGDYRAWCNREGVPLVTFDMFEDSAYLLPKRSQNVGHASGSTDPIPFEPGARRHIVKQ